MQEGINDNTSNAIIGIRDEIKDFAAANKLRVQQTLRTFAEILNLVLTIIIFCSCFFD